MKGLSLPSGFEPLHASPVQLTPACESRRRVLKPWSGSSSEDEGVVLWVSLECWLPLLYSVVLCLGSAVTFRIFCQGKRPAGKVHSTHPWEFSARLLSGGRVHPWEFSAGLLSGGRVQSLRVPQPCQAPQITAHSQLICWKALF